MRHGIGLQVKEHKTLLPTQWGHLNQSDFDRAILSRVLIIQVSKNLGRTCLKREKAAGYSSWYSILTLRQLYIKNKMKHNSSRTQVGSKGLSCMELKLGLLSGQALTSFISSTALHTVNSRAPSTESPQKTQPLSTLSRSFSPVTYLSHFIFQISEGKVSRAEILQSC